jgi:hypothetical protein
MLTSAAGKSFTEYGISMMLLVCFPPSICCGQVPADSVAASAGQRAGAALLMQKHAQSKQGANEQINILNQCAFLSLQAFPMYLQGAQL